MEFVDDQDASARKDGRVRRAKMQHAQMNAAATASVLHPHLTILVSAGAMLAFPVMIVVISLLHY